SRHRLMTPPADAVVATVVSPRMRDDARAVADLHLETRRAHDIETEHAVIVVAAERVRDREVGRPYPVECGADVVALLRLAHEVVQFLRHGERRLCERDAVMPFV